jgi:carbonic anhydrase/acetyltransferase-like protein (isoleucine patch superfamily)
MEAKKGRREMKKFELTTEFITNMFGKKLFRIKALVEFGNVKAGELGGYVEKEENVSQDGNAWVSGDARVSGNAWVYGNARVYGNAEVSGDAWVSGNAWVYGNARVSGNAEVSGNAWVSGNARVYGDAEVSGNAWVSGNARVSGNAEVSGNAWVSGNARVYGDAWVSGDADYALVQGFGTEFRCTTFYRGKNKKIMVNCGCFHGDLEGFRKQVKETRNGKIAKEYLMIADLMEYHFTSEDSSNE